MNETLGKSANRLLKTLDESFNGTETKANPFFKSEVSEKRDERFYRERDERFYRDLIETVKRYPSLYDKCSPDYKKGKDRHEYWSKVELDMFKLGYVAEDTACRHIWRKVVRKFGRECSLFAKATASSPYVSQWPHFEAMEFMKPFLSGPEEAVQKSSPVPECAVNDPVAEVAPQTLLTKAKGEKVKNAQTMEVVQNSQKNISTSTAACSTQPLFMFFPNSQLAGSTTTSPIQHKNSSQNSLTSLLHHNKMRVAIRKNHSRNPYGVNDVNISPIPSSSAFSVDRHDAVHDFSESHALQNSIGCTNDGLRELVAQVRGAADLVKFLKQRTDNTLLSTNLLADTRNVNFVTTICGLASQLTESQAERFRKRVLVSSFDIFQQVCAEDGELI